MFKYVGLILFTCTLQGFSQPTSPDPFTHKITEYSLGVYLHQGSVWAHSPGVANTRGTRLSGFQVELIRTRLDAAARRYSPNLFRSGFSFYYTRFSRSFLGEAYSLGYFLEPLLIAGPKAELHLRAAGGLAYATNPHDAELNPSNFSYSLPVNVYLALALGFKYKLSKAITLDSKLWYSHFSNGALQTPNLGLNFPSLSLGIEYKLHKLRTAPIPMLDFSRHWRFDASVFWATKTIPAEPHVGRYIYGIDLHTSRKLNLLHALTGGVELLRDGAGERSMEINGKGGRSAWQMGLRGGHEFLFTRFLFSQELGFYLFNQNPTLSFIYHRWGVQYKITQHVFVGVNMQAHAQRANFLDARLTYAFYKK